jgi:hypothetical protein
VESWALNRQIGQPYIRYTFPAVHTLEARSTNAVSLMRQLGCGEVFVY